MTATTATPVALVRAFQAPPPTAETPKKVPLYFGQAGVAIELKYQKSCHHRYD